MTESVAPVSTMNHSDFESLKRACTRIKLPVKSDGSLSELFPEMKRTFGGGGWGFRAALCLFGCCAKACDNSRKTRMSGMKIGSRILSFIAVRRTLPMLPPDNRATATDDHCLSSLNRCQTCRAQVLIQGRNVLRLD